MVQQFWREIWVRHDGRREVKLLAPRKAPTRRPVRLFDSESLAVFPSIICSICTRPWIHVDRQFHRCLPSPIDDATFYCSLYICVTTQLNNKVVHALRDFSRQETILFAIITPALRRTTEAGGFAIAREYKPLESVCQHCTELTWNHSIESILQLDRGC